MIKFLKVLGYGVLMLSLIIIFLPKKNLYYEAEHLLQKNKIFIAEGSVNEEAFGLELIDARIYFEKLDLMKVDSINISSYLFYSSVELNYIEVNEGFSDFLPQDISQVQVEHVFYDPMNIHLKGENSDSHFFGNVDLSKREINVHLRIGKKSAARYRKLLRKLKKEEGGYIYVYKF